MPSAIVEGGAEGSLFAAMLSDACNEERFLDCVPRRPQCDGTTRTRDFALHNAGGQARDDGKRQWQIRAG